MGACVSRCYPCSSSSPSTAGGSPVLSHLHTAKHAVAVHPLPLPSNSPAPTMSTSSPLLSAASSSASMATTTSTSSSSSATTRSYSSSSSSPRPFSAGNLLKVRTCRDMEVVVLDPNRNRNKNKLSRPATTTRRPLLPRTPPALSVVKSPTKKKPGTTSNGRRTTAPTATAVRRVRPLPPRAPLAGAWAGGSASCRKKRLSASPSSCRSPSADLDGRRKSGGAATAGASGVGGGEFVDDLNNPLISMDCFIFL